ncbi:MAG TPA: hypothetical protein DD733_07140 [Clostridiales bacterium]|nr:hypothetical protein [Eubacteriales bacterium]HBR31844.1 hypothetical protein [Clostridiales bacterium]
MEVGGRSYWALNPRKMVQNIVKSPDINYNSYNINNLLAIVIKKQVKRTFILEKLLSNNGIFFLVIKTKL